MKQYITLGKGLELLGERRDVSIRPKVFNIFAAEQNVAAGAFPIFKGSAPGDTHKEVVVHIYNPRNKPCHILRLLGL